jgi:hypothetical protein
MTGVRQSGNVTYTGKRFMVANKEPEAGNASRKNGYIWLFALSSLYAFLCSPYLTDMMRPGFDAYSYFLADDFQNVWTSAHLVLRGKIETLFDFAAYQQELPFKSAGFNWSYPLHMLLLVLPLGAVSYAAAYAIWSAGGMASFLYVLRRLLPRYAPAAVCLLLLALSPASVTNYIIGQTGFFTAALFLGGFYLVKEKKPVPAGILFGILTIKPQLGLLIPFALLVLKEWKAIVAAGVTTVALIALSVAIWGVAPWQMFLERNGTHLFTIHQMLPDQPGSFLMSSVYGGLRNSGVSFEVSIAAQIVSALSALVITCYALHREGLTARTILLLSLGAIIMTPYAHGYDMTMVAAALLAYLFSKTPSGSVPALAAEYVVFSALWALPLLTWVFRVWEIPLTPIILIAAFYLIYQDKPSSSHIDDSKAAP